MTRTGTVLLLILAMGSLPALATEAEVKPADGKKTEKPATKKVESADAEEKASQPADPEACKPAHDPMADLLNTLEDLHRGPDDKLVVKKRPAATDAKSASKPTRQVQWREVGSKTQPEPDSETKTETKAKKAD